MLRSESTDKKNWETGNSWENKEIFQLFSPQSFRGKIFSLLWFKAFGKNFPMNLLTKHQHNARFFLFSDFFLFFSLYSRLYNKTNNIAADCKLIRFFTLWLLVSAIYCYRDELWLFWSSYRRMLRSTVWGSIFITCNQQQFVLKWLVFVLFFIIFFKEL